MSSHKCKEYLDPSDNEDDGYGIYDSGQVRFQICCRGSKRRRINEVVHQSGSGPERSQSTPSLRLFPTASTVPEASYTPAVRSALLAFPSSSPQERLWDRACDYLKGEELTSVYAHRPFSHSGYTLAMDGEVEDMRNAISETCLHNPEGKQVVPYSDSGYASTTYDKLKRFESTQNPNDLECDDVGTIYSDVSTLGEASMRKESYISELADDLFSKIYSEQPDGQIMERISGILPEYLKDFALKVGYNAPTQMHLDVMFFVHKYRRHIVAYFKERYSHEKSLPDVQSCDPSKIPLAELMSRWYQNLEGSEYDVPVDSFAVDDMMSQNFNEEAEEENEEIHTLELLAYRDFIFKSSAYEWLLASLRREILLTPAEPNCMDTIRRKIIESLPKFHKFSRKQSTEAYKITFGIEWDPLAFIREQGYREVPDKAIEIAITLTGSAKDAQALSCAQYLCQTWPLAGEHIIQLVKDVVRSRPGHRHTCDLPDQTKLVAWIHESKFMVEAVGTRPSVAEIGEQFAWLGAALRSPPYELRIAYCMPFISSIRVNNCPHSVPRTPSGPDILCEIDFIVQEREEHLNPSNSQHWHNIVRNPVIVKGYPIRRRSEPDTGLEVSPNMMGRLARTRRVDTFSGRLFIKGFSAELLSMDIPTIRESGRRPSLARSMTASSAISIGVQSSGLERESSCTIHSYFSVDLFMSHIRSKTTRVETRNGSCFSIESWLSSVRRDKAEQWRNEALPSPQIQAQSLTPAHLEALPKDEENWTPPSAGSLEPSCLRVEPQTRQSGIDEELKRLEEEYAAIKEQKNILLQLLDEEEDRVKTRLEELRRSV